MEKDIAKVFKALCDPTRVAIVRLLRENEKCACELSKSLHITQSNLSYHMKILCDSGLVDSWTVGKWTHYKVSSEGSARALCLLQDLVNT